MAHDGGSHKRGLLRPSMGGSRFPVFIIIALSLFCIILFYNVYAGSARKNELQEEIDVMRVKNHMCNKDKLDAEKKFEMQSKTMKQKSESDNLKIKTLQADKSDLDQQIKELNQQIKTLSEQVGELKESKKSEDEQLSQIDGEKQALAKNISETMQQLADMRSENEKLQTQLKTQKTESVNDATISKESKVFKPNKPLRGTVVTADQANGSDDGERLTQTTAGKSMNDGLDLDVDSLSVKKARIEKPDESNDEVDAKPKSKKITEDEDESLRSKVKQDMEAEEKGRKIIQTDSNDPQNRVRPPTTLSSVFQPSKKNRRVKVANKTSNISVGQLPPGPPSFDADKQERQLPSTAGSLNIGDKTTVGDSNKIDDGDKKVDSNDVTTAPSVLSTKSFGAKRFHDTERNSSRVLLEPPNEKLAQTGVEAQDSKKKDGADEEDEVAALRDVGVGGGKQKFTPAVSLKLKESDNNKGQEEEYDYKDEDAAKKTKNAKRLDDDAEEVKGSKVDNF